MIVPKRRWVKLSWIWACMMLIPVSAISAAEQPADIDAWARTIEKLAPSTPTVPVSTPHKALVFSLATGYKHTVIPYVDRMLAILGKKSGVFTTTVTRDIEDLSAKNLAKYDLLVLNNTCSKGPRRNLLLDVLEKDAKYKQWTADQRAAKAKTLEQSMLDFVHGGKGLVVIHGAPTLLNNSPQFTAMVGGAFDYNPPNQIVTVRVVAPNHPLLEAFRGQSSFQHRDEPYCFKGAYEKLNFRPLLVFDPATVKDRRGGHFTQMPRYSAWIKRYGAGRVFYCSPSHFAASYENPPLLQFILDGIEYAAGDLKCDDSPRKTGS